MHQFKLSKSKFYGISYAILILVFSLFILEFYTQGDQRFYSQFYNICLSENNTLSSKFSCYKNSLGSQEPVYFILANIFNLFSSKNFFTAFTNSVLVYFFVKLTFSNYKHKWHRHFFILFILFNYYTLGLFFSTERLKIGFLFLLFALNSYNKNRIILIVTSLFSHVQMIFIIAPLFISTLLKSTLKIKYKVASILGSIIVLVFTFVFLGNHLIYKFNAYHEGTINTGQGFEGVIKSSIFIILAAISIKNYEPLIAGLPIIIMSYFLGPTRLSMMAFILYVIYVIRYKKQIDTIMLIVLSYYLYKSMGFISNVFTYGEGWSPAF